MVSVLSRNSLLEIFQTEEDRKNILRLQDLVDKLQAKVKHKSKCFQLVDHGICFVSGKNKSTVAVIFLCL